LKEKYEYPFRIQYSFIDYHKTAHPNKVWSHCIPWWSKTSIQLLWMAIYWAYAGQGCSEMIVHTCAASICIEAREQPNLCLDFESHIGNWICFSTQECTNHFYGPADIWCGFGELGMKDTCTLHCDYYHLLQEDSLISYFGSSHIFQSMTMPRQDVTLLEICGVL
jgi:hypothetical protein